MFSDIIKNHQHLVHTKSLILIITTVGKVLSQFQLPNTLPQSGGVQILIPSQYGQYSESQPSMLSGYPTISNPYGTGNAPTWSNNYSPVISQLPPGSIGIGSYQPQISQAGLQNGFLSTVPQGYTYSPLLSSPSSQFSGLPQGYSYPYTAVMGTGNMFNSQNIPQAVQVMPGVPQMAGFGAAVSPSTGRTVRILVPVYAPIPPSLQESQATNPNTPSGSPQPQTTSTSSDPSQTTPSNPSSDPSQTAAINLASSVPPPSINPTLTQSSNLSDPNTPSATTHSPSSPSNNASPSSTLTDNNSKASNSLSKINELIQAAANESDQNDTKLLGNIMDVVKEAIDVEKLRRKQGGIVQQGHDSSSDSASAITKSVNMLINKLVQDALTSQ